MHLLNLRLGLATNSSSTHSLIFLAKKPKDSGVKNGEFGWNFFTASSQKLKKQYLAILLQKELTKILPPNIAQIVFDNYLPDTQYLKGSYIDHQSEYVLPYEFGTNIVSEGFFKEFRDFILKDNLVILGGNDNEEETHPLDNHTSFTLPVPQDDGRAYVCRKDPIGNYWTLFRKCDGTKIRFSFNKDNVEKAYFAELVDIKITDRCNFGCSYCYMGSTPEGQDADTSFINYDLLDTLKHFKVFEVAFGGGEPTLHPNFTSILEKYNQAGIIPNFTTRNLKFLHGKQRNAIIANCGAFAYSLNISDKGYGNFEEEQIKDLRNIMNHYSVAEDKAVIHLVMGTVDQYKFKTIIKTCKKYDFPITLLGYKTTGRGKDFDPIEHDWWFKTIQKMNEEGETYKISIDTVLARTYEEELLQNNVPKWLFHTQEGTFSMYIDAVTQKFGKSSFIPAEEMMRIPMKNYHIDVDEFQRMYYQW